MIDLTKTEVVLTFSLRANGDDVFNPESIETLNEMMENFLCIGDLTIDKVVAHPKEEKAEKGSSQPAGEKKQESK